VRGLRRSRGDTRPWFFLTAAVPVVVAGALGTWTAARTQAGAARQPATAGDGYAIYQQDCAVCHEPDGSGSFRGPAIRTSGTGAVDFMVRTGRMPIRDPRASTPRRRPAYSEAEIRAIVAYVATFVTGPAVPDLQGAATADLVLGARQYRLNCAPCHQSAGSGGALAYGTTAPALVHSSERETVEAMRIGPGNMPAFAPTVLDDEDALGVARYVRYLAHPQDRGGLSLWHLGPVPEGLVAWVIGLGAVLVWCRILGTREPKSD